MYHQARTAKDSKTHKANSENAFRPPCTVVCAHCGAPMKRRRNNRCQPAREIWTCQNADCFFILNTCASALYDYIVKLLNRLIADPNLLEVAQSLPTNHTTELRQLQNEADRALDSPAFDRDAATAALFALAVAQYHHIDSDPHIGSLLRAVFAQARPLSCFDSQLFAQAVLQVQLGEGDVRLLLKNHQTIERKFDNADHHTR